MILLDPRHRVERRGKKGQQIDLVDTYVVVLPLLSNNYVLALSLARVLIVGNFLLSRKDINDPSLRGNI